MFFSSHQQSNDEYVKRYWTLHSNSTFISGVKCILW